MQNIQIDIIQATGPNCLNRGEDNQPKTFTHHDHPATYVSSQSWNFAARQMCKDDDEAAQYFKGTRTRLVIEEIYNRLKANKLSDDDSMTLAHIAAGIFSGKKKEKNEDSEDNETEDEIEDENVSKVLLYLSDMEYDSIVDTIVNIDPKIRAKAVRNSQIIVTESNKVKEESKKPENKSVKKGKGAASSSVNTQLKDAQKEYKSFISIIEKKLKTFKNCLQQDAADIALWGRMMAANPEATWNCECSVVQVARPKENA